MSNFEKKIIAHAVVQLLGDEILTTQQRWDLLTHAVLGLCGENLREIMDRNDANHRLQIKRGTQTQNETFIGLPGELTMDTDSKTLRLHDGETPGGIVIAPGNVSGTTAGDTVIDTGGNSAAWFRKYSSGWIEQGGITTNQNIEFPTTFSNDEYTVMALPSMVNAGVGNISVCYTGKSTSSVAIQVRWNGAGADDVEKSWFACGY